MKKMILSAVALLTLVSFQAKAEDTSSDHAAAPATATEVKKTVDTSKDKSGKLFEYISACMADRQASTQSTLDEVAKRIGQ